MTPLNAKQQALFDSIKADAIGGHRVEVLQSEVQTAKALERRGLITLDCIQTGDRKFYEATLVDPNQSVIKGIEALIATLQKGCQALQEGTSPDVVFEVLAEVHNEGRIEALHRALRDKGLELIKQNAKG
jgi:hypothetical protein